MRTVAIYTLAIAVAIAFTGCEERPRDNPLDPQNPETGGGPQGFRAIAAMELVRLAWDRGPAGGGVIGFRLERRPHPDSAFVPLGDVFPIASTGFDDDGVTNDIDYEYRLSFLRPDLSTTGSPALVRGRPGPEVVWVADPGADELVRLAPDGRTRTTTIGAVRSTNRIAIDPVDGVVWATEPFDGRVRTFATGGGALTTFPLGAAPNAVTVDSASGSAWIVEETQSVLVRVTRAGTTLATSEDFTNPVDVAAAGAGGAWVVDAAAGQLVRLNAAGARGTIAFPGGDPRRAAVDALDGSVWVTRFAAGEVVKYAPDGAILARTAIAPQPFAIDIDETRNLVWVGVDAGNEVVALDRTSGAVRHRVTGIARPRGLVVADRTGEVWVAAIASGDVVRIGSDGTILGRTRGFAAPFDVRIDPGPRALP